MTLLGLFVTVFIVVFILWLAQKYLPDPFRTIVLIFIVVVVIIWALTSFLPLGGVLNRPLGG